jgi:hypothetical protein
MEPRSTKVSQRDLPQIDTASDFAKDPAVSNVLVRQSILKGDTNAIKKFSHPATAGSENKMGRIDSRSGLAIIAATNPQAAAADSHTPGTARLPVT